MRKLLSGYGLGLVLVTTAALAWSTAGLFTRIVALDAPAVLFWRGLFGALGMVCVLAVLPGDGGLASFRRLGRPGLAYAVVTGVSMVLFVSALLATTVAHVAIVTAIIPFVAALLGWIVLRERPGAVAVLCSLAALFGLTVMVGLSGEGTRFGDALALAMAFLVGGMIILSRRFPDIPALAATALASALSAALALPFADISALAPWQLGVMVAFALVNQVLGFGFFALGARLLPPMESALITTLDAPLAPLWVWLVFGETPGSATLAGGGIVVAAVTVYLLRTASQPASPPA